MNVAFARNYYPSIPSVSPQGWVASHLDQLKIDLMNCHPWAMQLKAQEKGVYPEKILKEMPTDRGEYNLVIHKKKGYQPTVSMTWDDFYEILEMLVTNKIL